MRMPASLATVSWEAGLRVALPTSNRIPDRLTMTPRAVSVVSATEDRAPLSIPASSSRSFLIASRSTASRSLSALRASRSAVMVSVCLASLAVSLARASR